MLNLLLKIISVHSFTLQSFWSKTHSWQSLTTASLNSGLCLQCHFLIWKGTRMHLIVLAESKICNSALIWWYICFELIQTYCTIVWISLSVAFLGRPDRGRTSLAWRIKSRWMVVRTVWGVKSRVLATSAILTPHLTALTIWARSFVVNWWPTGLLPLILRNGLHCDIIRCWSKRIVEKKCAKFNFSAFCIQTFEWVL